MGGGGEGAVYIYIFFTRHQTSATDGRGELKEEAYDRQAENAPQKPGETRLKLGLNLNWTTLTHKRTLAKRWLQGERHTDTKENQETVQNTPRTRPKDK